MTFGLITEGVTDQILLRYWLAGIFDTSDLEVNELQPLTDATDDNMRFGGWVKVLDYCKSPKLQKAFEHNTHIIIQVDTDRCHEKGFEVQRIENGQQLTPSVLLEKVREKLEHILKIHQGIDFWNQKKENIFFAIAVEETECWLAPLYMPYPKDKAMTNNCLYKISKEIEAKEKLSLVNNKGKKNPQTYEKIAKQLRKSRNWEKNYTHNFSLKVFIDEIKMRFVLC
jgi:hypothetical protein